MRGIAFDKATVRAKDVDGRLHVAVSNISKATVDPYYGREIPDYERLGLNADTVYYLLRDPEELEKAAPSFNNLPVLAKHVPVSAEAHQPEIVIGSTGTDAAFNAPYLQNSTVIWAQEAIDDIESETKRQWSCAYRYRADMTPGNYLGLRFDGIMRDIIGNHLALVVEGRAGPDVIVGDSSGDHMKKSVLLAAAAKIVAFVQPKLAQDEGIEVSDVVQLIGALSGDPAVTEDQDPEDGMDVEDKPAVDADGDQLSQVMAFLQGKLSDEDMAELGRITSTGAADADPDEDEEDDKPMDKPAMDAAIARAEKSAIRRMNDLREAERIVRPHIGELAVAMDSADAVYKLALDAAKVSTKGVHPSAFRAMVEMLPTPETAAPIAMDHAGAAKSFAKRFPEAHTLIRS